MKLELILERLWQDYTTQNPSARKVYELISAQGETVLNDHIAFRTFNDPRINVDRLARVFVQNGYAEKEEYVFEAKKLKAKHYEHSTDKNMPRIFISELLLEEFSQYLQESIRPIIDQIPGDILAADDLGFCGRPWAIPSFEVYEKLRDESEYAAWVYVNGFAVNHFTVNVNQLKKFDGIKDLNDFLRSHGFLINEAGGEIKGNPSQFLEQSSIKAGLVKVEFIEGQYEIPGCYYEFAKRYPLADGKLFSGFIAKSADKIFESTDFYSKDN